MRAFLLPSCPCTCQRSPYSRPARSAKHVSKAVLPGPQSGRQRSIRVGRGQHGLRNLRITERSVASDVGISQSAEKVAGNTFEQQEYRHGLSAQQGSRDTMEDEVLVVDESMGGFFWAGVFDGHGGSHSVQWISEKFYDIFAKVVTEKQLSEALAEQHAENTKGIFQTPKLTALFNKFFQQADEALLKHLKDTGEGDKFAESGATCTLALIRSDCLVSANIGDSRAVLSRSGTPIALTQEHRLYGQGAMVEAEIARVKASGGWVEDGRVCNVLAVSRAFGDYEFKGPGLRHMMQQGVEFGAWTQEWADEQVFVADPVIVDPEVSRLMLQPEDEFVVVATDGLWDVMPNTEVVRWIRKELQKGLEPQVVADNLTTLALKRYTTDNVAVVLVDLQGPEYWKPSKPQKKAPGMFSFMKK